jgi:hypothetical protein
MKTSARKSQEPPGTRRYLVHLSCVPEGIAGSCRYLMRIQPWTPRGTASRIQAQERLFDDEYELVQAINPFLPGGSDVRNVLSHIEGPEGFLYLLDLNPEQARILGGGNDGQSARR